MNTCSICGKQISTGYQTCHYCLQEQGRQQREREEARRREQVAKRSGR